MEQPILSISILISERYDRVKKCLDSIQPILQMVPSELILTDTGCDREVRKLIEEYTDRIIEFTWIQDFSAARNAGLEKARGQWFMYLDDDEWFEDPSDIIQFLLSEEQEEYDVAIYYQRNYQNDEMSQYLDYGVDRILRRTADLHFENRVHEAYTGLAVRKTKQLDSYVHHVGNIFHSEEERRKKFERNGKLLELECKEKVDDMRLWHQYAVNFWAVGEWEESAKVCRKAIRRESNQAYWDVLHTDLLYCLAMQNKWEETIREGKEFLKKTLYPYEQFGVRQYLVQAYFHMREFSQLCDLSKKVINTYRYYKRKPEEFEESSLGANIYFSEENISRMLAYLIVAAVHNCDENSAKLLENAEIRGELGQIPKDSILKLQLVSYLLQDAANDKCIRFLERHIILRDIIKKCGYFTYLEQREENDSKSEEKKLNDVVLNALEFEPKFFEPETRYNFYIEPMMKNAWAAQLEILHRVGEICQEHGIMYFVDWGSLLGAVRHNGYIPWDDDIDIGMLRKDYRRFCEVIEQYDDIQLCNEYNTEGWGEHASRITTRTEISILRSDLKVHRGFLFPIGVDLFVVDYVPDDEALREEQKEVLNQIAAAYTAKQWLNENDFSSEEYADRFVQYAYYVHIIEERCRMKFSQEYPTTQELLILIDEVAGMYGPEDGKMMTQADCFVSRDNYFISADAYADVKIVPFENLMVPIPVGYDEILRIKYGEDYMTPISGGGGHGYPYYDRFIRTLFNLDEEAELGEARVYAEKMASDYYRNYINQTSEPFFAFEEAYFAATEEDGILVSEETKRIRAAEMEVLHEIQRICKENDLTYYAYGDALIGAASYHGFVPGGEDICIAMHRTDYKKFLKLMQTDLGSWFDYQDVYSHGNHTDMRCYVMTDGYMVHQDAYMERFHGCPYTVAVCVAAIDSVSENEQQEQVRTVYIQGLLDTAKGMPTEPPYDEEVLQVVEEWRQISDVVINTSVNLKREFTRCADVVSMACTDPQSEKIRISAELQEGINRSYPRAWFEDIVELPFENATIAVPKGYQEMIQEIS